MKDWGETTRTEVSLDFWLTVNAGESGRYPRRPSARISAGAPQLARDERALNLKVNLPLALFELPDIVASITVEHPNQPVRIDARAVADAVRGVVGMDVDISVKGETE